MKKIPVPIEIQKEIIQKYINGTSLEDIWNQYRQYSYLSIRQTIVDAGVKIERRSKYKSNTHIFDLIDNEEKAYWLGFLYADGCVYEKRHTLKLSLSKVDVEHMFKFKHFMESEAPIHYTMSNHKKPICSIEVTDIHLHQSLIDKGCIPHKTGKVVFPNFLLQNLVRHFIRGYFDGNGCITYRTVKNRPNYVTFNFMVDSTKEMLFEFNKYLPTNVDKEIPVLLKRRDNKFNDYTLAFGGNKQVLRLLDYLYDGSTIYLQRKYERYLLLKNMYS